MGIINKGILGGFSGIVGTVVGSRWRGIEYMRSRPPKRNGSSTPAQQAQRARFAATSAFLDTMKDLLQLGYKDGAVRMTERNNALSYHLKNAVTGEYPNVSILYPQVQISRGSLPNAANPVAAAGADATVSFGWIDNSGVGKAKPADRAILVAYCEADKRTVYSIEASRSSGEATLVVPAFAGKQVHTWISFIAADGEVATSVYTGAVAVV